ncbi:protein jag [Egicoccus sp. AB-alg2]|uniref:Jag family protein n=1 Tax=Egicoccus sp. AB-alg2 TaxID=3242693 RepID=UPI00359D34EC
MSRRIDVRGESLEEALTAAVATLLDCAPEKVDLSLDAPGADDFTGELRVDLTVAGDLRRERDEAERDDVAEDEAFDGDEDRSEESELITPEALDDEADAAADFLEGLLDALELPGDLRIRVHDDHAEVEVVEIGSGALIGRRGQTLEAIQELVRCALQREFQRRSRVKIDAEGYRSRRLEKLLEKAEEAIDEVLDTGDPVRLEPMDVFERKAIHHLVAEYDGVVSRSQGREPARRVIIELDD